jgi:hypothetical protein
METEQEELDFLMGWGNFRDEHTTRHTERLMRHIYKERYDNESNY